MNLKGVLPYFLTATTAISASFLPVEEAHAEELTIDIVNKDAVGSKERTPNCATLERVAEENKISCKFAVQVDGQQICKDEEYAGQDPVIASAKKYMTIFAHNAQKHGQCTREYAFFGKKALQNADAPQSEIDDFLSEAKQLYLDSGKNRSCVVVQALNQCEAEHGKDFLLD